MFIVLIIVKKLGKNSHFGCMQIRHFPNICIFDMLFRSNLREKNVDKIIYLAIIFRPNQMWIVLIVVKKSLKATI